MVVNAVFIHGRTLSVASYGESGIFYLTSTN